MKLRKYNEDQLRKAIKSSFSIRQTLQKLNVEAYGGNYDIFRKAIKYFQIDISHFTGQSWSKGKQFPRRRKNIEEYLSNKIPIQSNKLRKYLLEDQVFEHTCSMC